MTLPILDELDARGLIFDVTDRDELGKLVAGEQVTFYNGYDPSGSSLHLGHLVPLAMMVRLQRAGHKPIALVGGATGMIGDPSGRSDERNLLDADTLAGNVGAIHDQLARFLDFSPALSNSAEMVNNRDWTAPISFLDFLRDVGKHISVNYMIAKDSVHERLSSRDQGISYTEFSYMLLQAHDFVHLAATRGCKLQTGASDQWGNITAGCELQRKMRRPQVFGLVCPLLLDSEGKKMGKTVSGTSVWLDPARTTPYAFYQYLLNVPDTDVRRLLRIFSFRPLAEIDDIATRHEAAPHQRVGQKILAEEMTIWVHGADATRAAIAASQVMFGGTLESLRDRDLEPLLGDVPWSELGRDELSAGIALVDLLARTKLADSKGAARRLVSQGGVYINNMAVPKPPPDRVVTTSDLGTETMLVLRAGKKNYHIVRVV